MSVHQMVNHIARVVGRPAVLEDQRHRVVAYSPQSDVIDEVRRMTILQHHAGPAVSSWLRRLGVYSAKESTRVPQNTELGMLPRLLVPIRRAEESIGYLWFIDAPDAMDPDDVARADDFANRLAEEWTRSRSQRELDLVLATEQTRDLLLGTAKARARAAAAIIADGHFPDETEVRALQLSVRAPARLEPDAARELLDRAARRALRTAQLGGALHLHRGDRVVFVVPEPSSPEPSASRPSASGVGATDRAAAVLLDAAHVAFGGAAADGHDGPFRVSIGGSRSSLAAARSSAAEAERADRIADSFALPDPVIAWDRLGIHRGLDQVAAAGLVPADFQAGLDRLSAERDGRMLLDTAEAYLALGGRVQDTAARLNLHRTSLYHRLGRLEKILGIDLQNGVERLGLHLAILLMKVEHTASDRA
ncbi:CdaR family transcriptional regulator [Agromyces sp. LHK192]|uniref:PucR family transcriptional regulator n=1 Tax=Agromyces sp. LHK192 TaxID=2498704 RepID=UPI000FDC69ED|nr:helix-turn-helix domain-containing protein [Agromyces sp. LHK192]